MSQMTSTARAGARALNRPPTGSPAFQLRVVPGTPLRRGAAAFGIVCVVLLAAGLIGLLLLNTTLAQGSFVLHKLQTTSDELKDTQGILNQSLDASKSPGNLATRATSMGMVPARSGAFLRLSDGKVIGVAKRAPASSPFTVVGTTQPDVASSKRAADPSTPADPSKSSNAADPSTTSVSPARQRRPGNPGTAPASPAAGDPPGAGRGEAQTPGASKPNRPAATPPAPRPATPAPDAGRAGNQ